MDNSREQSTSESTSSGVAISKEVRAQGEVGETQASREGVPESTTPSSTTSVMDKPVEGADKTARNWAVAAHLSGLSLYLGIPFGNILGPLIIWLIKKDESPYAEAQAKEALNFQISLTLYGIGVALLSLVVIGFFLIPVLFVLHIVLTIVATLRASEGKAYRYPLTIRLIS